MPGMSFRRLATSALTSRTSTSAPFEALSRVCLEGEEALVHALKLRGKEPERPFKLADAALGIADFSFVHGVQ
jgi:hypothetical protein